MISRDQLTEEFYDRTSAQLLVQPVPMFLYARLFLRALNIELGIPASLGLAGREVSGQGAPYPDAQAQGALMLSDDLATELFAVKADFAGEPGHTIRFNRPKFPDASASGYSMAAREVGVNQSISVVPIEAGSEQTALTLKRFAGPYDSANGRVAPYGLDAFDATMGVHDLVKFVGTHMKYDFHRTLEFFFVTLAALGATTIRPFGMNAANDATAKAQFPLTYETMSRVSKSMDEANLPVLGDGRRVFVCSPTGEKYLKDDPQFARYAEFHKDKNPLYPGWFGSTPEFHCFKSTTLPVTANSNSIGIHTAHAMAPGAFLGGRGAKIKVAAATDDNYGEAAKVIWLAYLALGIADNRFVQKVEFTEDVS
jgi:hypothetical protein